MKQLLQHREQQNPVAVQRRTAWLSSGLKCRASSPSLRTPAEYTTAIAVAPLPFGTMQLLGSDEWRTGG